MGSGSVIADTNPDIPCPSSMPTAAISQERRLELVQVIRGALTQTSPHAGEVAGPIFDGNYDWHSSVHAHWALLSIARVTQDAELEATLRARITPEALNATRAYLNAHPDFELPYGQSWLLMMLWEMGQRPDAYKNFEFRQLQKETRERVLSWLEQSSFPEDGGLIGAHDSWLFSFLLTELSARGNAMMQKRLFRQWQQKINPARAEIAQFEPSDWDFLDLRSVLATVDQVTPGAHPALVAPRPWVPFQSPITSDNAHTAGAAMVRLWPHALQEAQSPASCARFETRMTEMFSRTDQWRDEFDTVAHWVPQFMWMGMWLEMGRP